MKTFKKLTAVFLLLFVQFLLLHKVKLHTLTVNHLISEMPEVKEAQAQLENFKKPMLLKLMPL